jgi:hypothetical protein
MSCQAGNWSNNPTFTYSFIDSSSGQVLQSGVSPEYKFSAAAAGSTVFMRLQATNAGGTGIDQTPPTAPIMPAAPAEPELPPAPSGHVLLASTSIAVQSDGELAIKLSCKGTGTCRGKLTLTVKARGMFEKRGRSGKGGTRRFKTTTIGIATFSIPPGKTVPIELKLNGTGRALLSADHGRLSATLTILKSSPAPSQAHTDNVQLVQQKAHGHAKK